MNSKTFLNELTRLGIKFEKTTTEIKNHYWAKPFNAVEKFRKETNVAGEVRKITVKQVPALIINNKIISLKKFQHRKLVTKDYEKLIRAIKRMIEAECEMFFVKQTTAGENEIRLHKRNNFRPVNPYNKKVK